MNPIKILTYNLRRDNDADGINSFTNRFPFIIDTLHLNKPDVIGFQEAKPEMLARLKASLEEYSFVGFGRNPDYSSEANPVAFLKSRFSLHGFEQFWLSLTPHVPGSRYEDQSTCPRICVFTILKPDDGEPFRFVNTHLDHFSASARLSGAELILSRLKEQNALSPLPTILTGDLNERPGSPAVTMLAESGFTDLTVGIRRTAHHFGRQTFDNKIDYIFATSSVCARNTREWTDMRGEQYLSDHFPVQTVVTAY